MGISMGDKPAVQFFDEMQTSAEPKPRTKVVIVDDHAMIVTLLIQIFESLGGYEVVGQAKKADEALRICEQEKPGMIILDLVLPDVSGLGLLKQIRTLCPEAVVVVFSGNLTAPLIRNALIGGVRGLISKGSTLEEFKSAIQTVSAGRTYLCAQSSESVRLMVRTEPVLPAKIPVLTQREQTVLRHIAAGMSSKEIAAKLGLSCYTVSNFRSKLSKKTGLHRAVHLSRYAAQIGLLDEPAGSRRMEG
jgi:two-component system nitrate/nitrite response regulator NarL